jgi:hypothetical protein
MWDSGQHIEHLTTYATPDNMYHTSDNTCMGFKNPMFIYNIILELLKTQNVVSFVIFICELVFPPPIKLLIIDIVKILLKYISVTSWQSVLLVEET